MRICIVLIIMLNARLIPSANARTLVVGINESFQIIQEAIREANLHDTVLVRPGHYSQHSIVIDKPLYLIGEGNPRIDAEHQAVELFVVMADSVVIEGFTLQNVGVSFLKELAAIKVRQSHHGSIRNNEILNCFFGVYLEYATHYQVVNNYIVDQADDEASAGNAIHVWKGDYLEITHNTLSGHRDGIYLEFVNNSQIHHNQSYRNLRYGLHFMFSNNDAYSANEFRENGAGVAVMFSREIRMQHNHFSHNWGGASYGLLLKEISDGEISGNYFVRNTIGILAEGANRIIIERNQFSLNGTALDMKGNSLDNEVLANNFLANTFEVVTNSQNNNNRYERNYWSGYVGYDLNRDGSGDEPYRPVNLFARITDQIPAATLMLHSFFVSLLEFSERIFPTIIPATLTDQYPQMQPYAYDQN